MAGTHSYREPEIQASADSSSQMALLGTRMGPYPSYECVYGLSSSRTRRFALVQFSIVDAHSKTIHPVFEKQTGAPRVPIDRCPCTGAVAPGIRSRFNSTCRSGGDTASPQGIHQENLRLSVRPQVASSPTCLSSPL
ncbi:hypothetical protein Tco_0708158 [Tanacetum coccineum]